MKKALFIRVLMSFMLLPLVFGCSIVSEQDLEDLQSHNAVTRKEVLQKLTKGPGIPKRVTSYLVGAANDRRAVEIMLETLKNENEPEEMQVGALKALARLADRTEIPIESLVAILGQNRGDRVQTNVIATLGKTKNSTVIPLLIRQLDNKQYMYVTIWALGEIGAMDAVPTLNQLLSSGDMYIRYNTRRALGKIAQSERNGESPSQSALGSEPVSDEGSNTFAFGRMVFEKYQDFMRAVFSKIAQRNAA
jgi:HEAT repeat protein